MTEPLLSKRQAAAHFAVSVRTVDGWLVDGAPHVRLAGRPKVRAAELEAWLERTGRLEQCGEPVW